MEDSVLASVNRSTAAYESIVFQVPELQLEDLPVGKKENDGILQVWLPHQAATEPLLRLRTPDNKPCIPADTPEQLVRSMICGLITCALVAGAKLAIAADCPCVELLMAVCRAMPFSPFVMCSTAASEII